MKFAGAITLLILFAASPLHGQVYNASSPDWVSTDSAVSTGGALVDVDRDGWTDFVVANGNDIYLEHLVVYYNRGNGTFRATPNWSSSDDEYNGHLSMADVNGDGWLDVAVGLTMAEDPGTPTARVYLNNAGTFSSTPDWAAPDELAAFHVSFGDVNGDGRPDLAVATGWPYSSPHAWHNQVYMNVNGTLEASPSWVSTDTWDLGDAFFCDANGDGWLDLVGVGEGTYTWVYLNDEGTLATTATWHTTDNNGHQFSLMGTYGDVDDDGWTDLFTTDNTQVLQGAGYMRRYDGLVGGLFGTTPSWSYFEEYGSAIALADVDADGALDLAIGGWWRRLHYFLNSGGVFGSTPDWSAPWPQDASDLVTETILFGDVDNDGLRWPVEVFDTSLTPGRHLFQLSRQPIERIESVSVDGSPLDPDEFTFDLVHGWVSVGPESSASVTVRYVYSLKPDMAVTNWKSSVGNYLYYNLNGAASVGDFYDNGAVDDEDYAAFVSCYTGPDNGPFGAGCDAGDADLDDDIDCDDWERFTLAWTGPEPVPSYPECGGSIPTISEWGIAVMTLLVLVSGTIVFRGSVRRV